METDHTVLVQGPLDDVRAIRRALRERGLDSELVVPPEGCGSS